MTHDMTMWCAWRFVGSSAAGCFAPIVGHDVIILLLLPLLLLLMLVMLMTVRSLTLWSAARVPEGGACMWFLRSKIFTEHNCKSSRDTYQHFGQYRHV